jgi:UDPglucose--hexose-1-phosphate uridylyltransferase
MDLQKQTHRRWNPLTREWVLVSPHRTQRPWQGQIEAPAKDQLPRYDPACYLCPGNLRAGGARNPNYDSTFVFANDFGALSLDTPQVDFDQDGLLIAHAEKGCCRVVCFSPRHDLTLARMPARDIERVVDLWIEQYIELSGDPDIDYVQIFENRGAMMGCSNPHPHGQIWASASIPSEPAKEFLSQCEYFGSKGTQLLGDYLQLEHARGERLVLENDHFTVLVPFWAVWPFETLIVARRPVGAFDQFIDGEREALADVLQRLTIRYDNLFRTSFPYSMGFHPAPSDRKPHPEWRFHTHFYPPLLRSATIRKFMVGFEMLGMPQRDLTAETAAGRLRESGE